MLNCNKATVRNFFKGRELHKICAFMLQRLCSVSFVVFLIACLIYSAGSLRDLCLSR